MPTLTFVEGFEHQTIAASTGGAAASNTYAVPTTPAALTFVTGRDLVGKALHVVENGTTVCNYVVGLPASQTYVGSLYFRVAAAPSIDSILCAVQTASSINAIFRVLSANGKISCKARSGTQVDGPVITDNAWHRLDFSSVATGTTWTVNWAVDGSAQTAATIGSQVATNQTGFYVGSQTAADTLTADFDDIAMGVTGADHPLGSHYVTSVVPNADGTHSPGTSVKRNSDSAVLDGSHTAWDSLDDWPSGTDYVYQDAIDAAAYAEVGYGNTSATSIWGISHWCAFTTSTTAGQVSSLRLYDASNNQLGILALGTAATVAGSKNLIHHLALVSVGGWDTDFNGIKARFGYASDVSPNPQWQSLMMQYAVAGSPPASGDTDFMGAIPI